jgi:hypothetical protein
LQIDQLRKASRHRRSAARPTNRVVPNSSSLQRLPRRTPLPPQPSLKTSCLPCQRRKPATSWQPVCRTASMTPVCRQVAGDADKPQRISSVAGLLFRRGWQASKRLQHVCIGDCKEQQSPRADLTRPLLALHQAAEDKPPLLATLIPFGGVPGRLTHLNRPPTE